MNAQDMRGSRQESFDDSKRYDVIRPLKDGERYVMLGANLSAADAAECHHFHSQCDRKYAGRAHIRPVLAKAQGGAS